LNEAEVAKFPLLAPLADAEREAVMDELELLDLEPGTPLFREGESADAALFIVSGRVRVHARRVGVGAEIGAGEVLGSLSLVVDGPREASAETLSRTRIWRLSRASFRRLLEVEPTAACRLLESIVCEYASAVRSQDGGDAELTR
jgi:CRP-like cAMP-binding protein